MKDKKETKNVTEAQNKNQKIRLLEDELKSIILKIENNLNPIKNTHENKNADDERK